MKISKWVLLIFVIFSFVSSLQAQFELVPVSHPVYDYLKKMQLKGLINDYNSGNIPISRKEVGEYLTIINDHQNKLAGIDKQFLDDYKVEFENDISGEVKNQESLLSDFSIDKIFKDKKQKYLYFYKDTNATFFLDVMGNISHRESNGDSIKTNSITLGELGFRLTRYII